VYSYLCLYRPKGRADVSISWVLLQALAFFGNPVTISIQLTLALLMREQEMVVSSFLRSVLRCGRRVLCTGFRGGELWSLTRCQAPILSHFGQANNLCRLVAYDDASNVPLRALAVAACSRIERC
jgi:hypothetical protein